MYKITETHETGKTPETHFKAQRPLYVAPLIVDQYIDDDGELQFVLESGNTQLASKYNSLWNPVKGKVLPEHQHKSLDPRHLDGTIHKKPRR